MLREVWLRSAVHAVDVEDDLVVLDVAADRYLCMPAAASRLTDDRRGLRIASDEEAPALAAAGLPRASSGAVPGGPPPDLPRVAAIEASPAPANGLAARTLVAALLDVTLRYRGRSFAEILAY